MQCLYCGKHLPLLKKLTGGGEFCSDAHKEKYHEEYNRLALTRLLQAQSRPEDIKIDPKRHGRVGYEDAEEAAQTVARAAVERAPEPAVVAQAEAETAKPVEVREVAARAPAPRPTRAPVEEAVPPSNPAGFLTEANGLQPIESRPSERVPECEFLGPGGDMPPSLPPTPERSIPGGSLVAGHPSRNGLAPEPRPYQSIQRTCESQNKEFDPPDIKLPAVAGQPETAPFQSYGALAIPVCAWPLKGPAPLEAEHALAFQAQTDERPALTSALTPFAEPLAEDASEPPIQAAPTVAKTVARHTTNGNGANGAGRNGSGSYHVEETRPLAVESSTPSPERAALKLIRISPKHLELPVTATGTTNLLMGTGARLPKQTILPLRPKMAMGTVPVSRNDRRPAKPDDPDSGVGVWTPEFTAVETGGLLRKLGGLLRKR